MAQNDRTEAVLQALKARLGSAIAYVDLREEPNGGEKYAILVASDYSRSHFSGLVDISKIGRQQVGGGLTSYLIIDAASLEQALGLSTTAPTPKR